MPRPKTRSCRWSRSSGSSGAASEVYRAHLDDRNVETYARRRFGLYPQLPQIAKRFGFRFALHLGFDAGRFPIRAETKRLWESPDGSNLETLLRPPMAADRPSQGWLVPWRMAATMKDDHVAALPLVHWPKPVAPWYLDLRRAAGYSPVLGRWTTLNDFFHLTDRPYETHPPRARHLPVALPGAGGGAARARADRRGWPVTIGCGRGWRRRGRSRRWRGRSRRPRPAPRPSAGDPPDLPALEEIENLIETGRHDEAATALARVEPVWSAALARGIVGDSAAGRGRRAPRARLPRDQPAQRAAARGGGLARRGARPASRRPAAGRPVHR